MSLSTKSLDDIEEADLEALVENQVREAKKIEYKRSLPGRRNSDRREFLADVSSFSNSSGGDLLYGIETEGGAPTCIPGLDIQNIDATILRLENMILNGIKPRIPGLRIRDIQLQNGNIVLIIRLPRSWILPHMVTFDNLSRFYSRNSAGKYQLDVSEIRSLFSFSQTIPERIRAFRMERLGNIIAGETPFLMEDVPKIVLHLIPLNVFSITSSYDLSIITDTYPKPMYTSAWSGRHNFDGFLTYTQARDSNTARTCLQIFRNGIFEAIETLLLSDRCIPSVAYERELLESVPYFLSLQEKLGIEPPILIMLSLLGVYGFEMAVDRHRFWLLEVNPIDRENLIIPEVVIENYDIDIANVMRPIFDSVWNAAGWSKCMNYDEDGNWVGH